MMIDDASLDCCRFGHRSLFVDSRRAEHELNQIAASVLGILSPMTKWRNLAVFVNFYQFLLLGR